MTDTPKSNTSITINGQEVDLEKAPEFVRRFMNDTDKNGIPDLVEDLFKNPLLKMALGKTGEKFKALLEKLEGAGTTGTSISVSTTSEATGVPPSAPRVASPTPPIDYRQFGIEDPEQKRSFLSTLVILLLGGVIAGALWFFLRGRTGLF